MQCGRFGDYVCSKWAVIGLTQTLALELVDAGVPELRQLRWRLCFDHCNRLTLPPCAGVRVNAVCPGPIEGERIEQVMDMHMQAEGIVSPITLPLLPSSHHISA